MSAKIIVSVVSLILVVGVVIGVVVVSKSGEDSQIQSQTKWAEIICGNSDKQALCHETMKSVEGVDSVDPKAYIAAAVKATTESVIKALNMSDRLTVENSNSSKGIQMALNDCKDLLQSAMDSLELSINMVQSNSIQQVENREADFKNWLSAVLSYKLSCTEGFDENIDSEKKMKELFETQSLDQVQELTTMTLDIVTGLSHVLENYGLKINLKPSSRRLLATDGYPTWFSAADRKLLSDIRDIELIKEWRDQVTPNVVVAQDGSGQFTTIGEAIKSYPKNYPGRYAIYVKAGLYNETVFIHKNVTNLFIYGDGPGKTIITGNKNYITGTKTFETATFVNTGHGFIAKGLTIENTAGPEGHQAVAFRNQGDMSAILDCHFVGYQDTLYAQSNRQLYHNCVIFGTIDFIFGMSATMIQQSQIIVRKPNPNQFNTVTADGTYVRNASTGIVIQDCNIIPEQALFPVRFEIKTYLGRPWKNFSRTVVMESTLGDFIHPEGWTPWNDTSHFEDTCYIAEYNNVGPGANLNGRIKWKGYHGLISRDEASRFTAVNFLKNHNTSESGEVWLHALGVPHYTTFARA